MATFGNGRRVAIVAGVRTPFAKAGTAFKSISAIDLGKLCVAELLQRTNLDGKEVQSLVFGTVVPSVLAPNIAREVSLLPLLPKGVEAYSVSRACASANQAITDAADQIALGHHDISIAGGSESPFISGICFYFCAVGYVVAAFWAGALVRRSPNWLVLELPLPCVAATVLP